MHELKPFTRKTLPYDLPAGIVVFLVALPLCLGIALASGAPAFSGIIAGVVGGIIIGTISGSQVSVSGPAAGLTVIVLGGITELASPGVFFAAVLVAGVIQLIIGLLRAGIIAYFFPHSVIKGMLAAIGLILILKQFPHALGYDADYEGDESFYQPDKETTFSEFLVAFQHPEIGAVIIALVALGILLLWERPFIKNNRILGLVPGALLAVLSGVGLNQLFLAVDPSIALFEVHLVNLPQAKDLNEFTSFFSFPDFSSVGESKFWIVAGTIAIVASIETLLSVDAADKLDHFHRRTPASRELCAQGAGNIISGLLGGIPITAVIVRSSANIAAGARTKVSAIFHGILLLLSVALIPGMLNTIPLAALAAILIQVGFKLVKPSLFVSMWKKGWSQFVPFTVTIIAILLTDLLIGIGIGMALGLVFVLISNYKRSILTVQDGNNYVIKFTRDVSFLNKAHLIKTLEKIPENAFVNIEIMKSHFVDQDIKLTLEDFQQRAKYKKIQVEVNELLK